MSQSGQEGVPSGTGPDSAQGQGGTGTGADGEQTGANSGQGNGADGAQQNSQTDDAGKTVSREDFDRLQRQLSEADRKRTEAENRAKELERKDQSELDRTKGELEDVTKERDTLVAEVQKLKLNNAFLASNTITWQNPEVALEIAQARGYLEEVQDDKGAVDTKKMSAALTKLSTEHGYLVKTETGEEETPAGPSGAPAPRGTNNAKDDKAQRDRLAKQFPALGRLGSR